MYFSTSTKAFQLLSTNSIPHLNTSFIIQSMFSSFLQLAFSYSSDFNDRTCASVYAFSFNNLPITLYAASFIYTVCNIYCFIDFNAYLK